MSTSRTSAEAWPFRAQFDIHGLPLDLAADHPLPFQTIAEEIRFFRVNGRAPHPRAVRLTLSALPGLKDPFLRKSQNGFSRTARTGKETILYQKVFRRDVTRTVIDWKRSRIDAAIGLDRWLFPNYAYYRCFFRPVSFWLKERGHYSLHAGCVAEKGKGVLILGSARAGKSSFTTSAVREGFQFLGDEQPILSSRNGGLRVLPFPRRVRLRRSVLRLFPEIPAAVPVPESGRIFFHMEDVWPACLASECVPRLLIFPRFKTRHGLRWTRISSSQALARLLRDPYFLWYQDKPWADASRRHLDALGRLADRIPAFLLEYGEQDLPGIPSVLRQLLRRVR